MVLLCNATATSSSRVFHFTTTFLLLFVSIVLAAAQPEDHAIEQQNRRRAFACDTIGECTPDSTSAIIDIHQTQVVLGGDNTTPPIWTPAPVVLANDTNTTDDDALQSSSDSDSDIADESQTTRPAPIDSKQHRRQKFVGVFERLRDELVEYMKTENMPAEAVEWFRRNLEHNVPGGKLNRGMSVVDSAEILKGRALNDEEYFKAAMLGWCVELLQASLLVADDIMDKSITRRGQPCWYRVEGVGVTAINDAFMLEGAMYRLLKQHFRHEPCYVHILELFHDATFQTEMGQLVDLITAPEDRVDLNSFSFEKHAFIAQYKTAYYSFYLPVALALQFCSVPESYEVRVKNDDDDGKREKENVVTVHPYDVAQSILLPLGEYFQVQDDYLDYAASPEVLGKIGTDIVDNKCSWCVNVAIELATVEQRAVLDANYGRKDRGMEERIKEVYDAVGVRERYREYEEAAKERIERLIVAGVPEGEGVEEDVTVLKMEVLKAFLDKIYRRAK